MSGNTTLTVTYVTPTTITPTVTVTPSATSILTTQALTAAVAVSGGSGNPVPGGTVILSAGSYTSAPATLSNGAASFNIPAGSIPLPNGTFGANFILTAVYTPDAASSAIYSSAQGTVR